MNTYFSIANSSCNPTGTCVPPLILFSLYIFLQITKRNSLFLLYLYLIVLSEISTFFFILYNIMFLYNASLLLYII